MPRTVKRVPTFIYFLCDSQGTPFYCGKTISKLEHRLKRHMNTADAIPDRPTSSRIIAHDRKVSIHLVAVIPFEQDWRLAERFWIATLRYINPSCTNISAGGDGVPGFIPSAITRAKIGAKHRGKKLMPEQIESLRQLSLGRVKTAEEIAKFSASLRGRRLPPITIERMRQAHKGIIITAETREKMRLAKLGKKQTPEHVANMRAAITGKPKSEAHKAALKAAWIVRRQRTNGVAV